MTNEEGLSGLAWTERENATCSRAGPEGRVLASQTEAAWNSGMSRSSSFGMTNDETPVNQGIHQGERAATSPAERGAIHSVSFIRYNTLQVSTLEPGGAGQPRTAESAAETPHPPSPFGGNPVFTRAGFGGSFQASWSTVPTRRGWGVAVPDRAPSRRLMVVHRSGRSQHLSMSRRIGMVPSPPRHARPTGLRLRDSRAILRITHQKRSFS